MGRFHVDAVGRGAIWSLKGVVDRHLDRCVGIPRHLVGDSLHEMLARFTPDAVVVAVPPDFHEEVARVCLEHGCHVLIEKPICPTLVQAQGLAGDFFQAGQILFGGHSERFNPVFVALCANLGRIGKLQKIEAAREGMAPPKPPAGGVVFDLAVHDLDLIRRLAGERLELERGVGSKRTNGRIAVSTEAWLRWSSGCATLRASWGEHRERRIRVTGSDGVLEADLLGRALSFMSGSVIEAIPLEWSDPLEAEHASFLAACRGEGDPRIDLEPQIEAVGLAEDILAA